LIFFDLIPSSVVDPVVEYENRLCDLNASWASVHMGARDGSDPMDFDYRLKPGITKETNALAIARMAGVLK
jgi:DNA mismatch repair ATPase MutS